MEYVGWSDSIPKNRQFQPRPCVARAAKFPFSKNRRGLKIEYFFVKICRILPYTSENNRQKENLK